MSLTFLQKQLVHRLVYVSKIRQDVNDKKEIGGELEILLLFIVLFLFIDQLSFTSTGSRKYPSFFIFYNFPFSSIM